MDQMGLHIERRLGHAIGIPGVPPAAADAACLGGDVDDELMFTPQKRPQQPVRHPQRPQRVHAEHLIYLLKIQLVLNRRLHISQYSPVIE
ncbi:hypothetical protein D3C87_1827120 [compost metagenome]